MESEGYWKSCAKCAKHLDEILEDNEDIIEEYIHVWNKESVLWPGMKLSSKFVSSSDKCNECEKQAIRGGYLGEHERAGHEAWSRAPDSLMRKIRFVHFFIDLSTLVYFFRSGHATLEKIQWKEVRCHCSMRALNLRKLWWSDYTECWGYLYWSNSWRIPWL